MGRMNNLFGNPQPQEVAGELLAAGQQPNPAEDGQIPLAFLGNLDEQQRLIVNNHMDNARQLLEAGRVTVEQLRELDANQLETVLTNPDSDPARAILNALAAPIARMR